MRLRNIPGAKAAITGSSYVVQSGKVNGSSVLQKNNRFI